MTIDAWLGYVGAMSRTLAILLLALPLGCIDDDKDTADTGADADTDTDTVGADSDGDGFSAADGDCDDGDPDVNPGAAEVCNGVDDDCDSATTEAGMAALVDPAGVVTDLTDALGGGTANKPTIVGDGTDDDVYVTEGTVNICAGTWYAKLVCADEFTDVAGVGSAGAGATTLTTGGISGGAIGSIVAVGNGTVALDGFTISGGTGSVFTSTQGGGVAASHTLGGAAPAVPNLTLTDCVVTGNEAAYGGGIAVRSYG